MITVLTVIMVPGADAFLRDLLTMDLFIPSYLPELSITVIAVVMITGADTFLRYLLTVDLLIST